MCWWHRTPHIWHHLHCRWHHIHSITPNLSIYDVTSTSGMASHPPYQTSSLLYLCHHNLSTDITPTLVWHHTHLLCDITCTIYNITSTPYVITLLYIWHQSLYIWNHIQYVGQRIHYTCDITATNLCQYTHCIDDITPSTFMISLLLCIKTSYPLNTTWQPLDLCPHTHSFSDITSLVCMIPHELYV